MEKETKFTDEDVLKMRKNGDPLGDLILIEKEAEFYKKILSLEKNIEKIKEEERFLQNRIISLKYELGNFIRRFVCKNPTTQETKDYTIKLWLFLYKEIPKLFQK